MPTPSSTASFTTPIASIWPARACASGGPRHEIDARSKAGSPHPRRGKAVDNGGLRYGAMESALRPPLPTATPAAPRKPSFLIILRRPEPRPLDPSGQAKHHSIDPRKQTPGGRLQIGTPAGFKSESVAGFLLECVAGFVGNRKEFPQFDEPHLCR